jgi:molybdopterin molybdotransferase
MVTVTEAKEIITKFTRSLDPTTVSIDMAAGLVLAKDVHASLDIPAFRQSSMDGYAFSFDDIENELQIDGEIEAGSSIPHELQKGKAMRIFTGAPLPAGADTVVMQEKVRTENGILFIEDKTLQRNSNVRPIGSEIKTGELAMKAGSLLSPAAVGFLAGIGVAKAEVIPNPVVSIILTGNELQQPGQPLSYGQVYESNSFSLTAALSSLRIPVYRVYESKDEIDALTNVLKEALTHSDLVLLTGGVSVGDYDFVIPAANACGVMQRFHKVKQKPGKPLFFGTKESRIVFGLPGNPSSVLTCFYQYVTHALAIQTKRSLQLRSVEASLAKDCRKPAALTHFQNAYYDGEKVIPLSAQESYRLNSYATANCILVLDAERETFMVNDIVTVHLLPA